MDFERYHSDYYRKGHAEDMYNGSRSSRGLDKSSSFHSLPTRHNKYGYSYLPSSVSSMHISNDRPSSRLSEQVTSRYGTRASSNQSDRMSRYSDHVSSHYSDRASSRMSDFSPPPPRDGYSTGVGRRASSLSRDSMPSVDRQSSYERTTTSSSLYDNSPSIHSRVPAVTRNGSRSGSGYSSHYREEFSSRNSYNGGGRQRSYHPEDEDNLNHRFSNMSDNFDDGSLDHHYDQSSSDTLNGSSRYGSDDRFGSESGKFHTISSNTRHSYKGGKSGIFSDGFGYGYNATGSETSRKVKDFGGSKSYSAFSSMDRDHLKSSSKFSQDGRSSPTVNGGSSHNTSDTGIHSVDDNKRHTGWFRNHQYGPLLSKEANLDDLREDISGITSRRKHVRNEDSYDMSSKSMYQLDSRDERSFQDYSTERDARTRMRDDRGMKTRAASQDRDMGYYSLRKEQPFNPPEKFHRSLSEGRQYHSMTNLDTMTKRSSRSRSRRHHHRGISAGKELGVASTLSATDLSQPDVNELTVMSYAASFHKAKGAKREPPKPVKIEWGKCAQLSQSDIIGAERSEEVFQNTKGLVMYQGQVNVPIIVKVKLVNDRAITTDISAQVDSPGDSVPITLKKISSDEVEASVLPLQEGIHTINVRCRGDLIEGCPIRIMVMPDQSSFPENVKVGKITTAVVGEELQFQVDVSEAGKGELMVTISNGLHELPVRLEQDGSMFTIFTIADAVGDYFVNILWDRSPVTDEPAKLRVFDPNRVTASGDGLRRGREDSPATFIVDPTKAGPAEMKVSAEGPNSMAKVTVSPNADKTYTVTYVPTEVGIFNIKVQYGGRLIYGAPFQAKITDPRKVRFAGFPTAKDEYGNLDFLVKESYRVEVDTEEAGPGDLRAEMETDNAILPVQIDQISDSRYLLIFSPPKEGDCVIRVRWAGSDVKGSPFKGYAREKELPIDHTKVKLRGEGFIRSKVYVPTEFIIDGSLAGAGVPTVSITGTSEDVDVKLEPYGIQENMYKVTYMAEKAGTHIVYVAWSDKQIPNSPFKVNVAASPHAEKVRASSFKGLIVGQTGKCIIDTRDAAEGELSATCMGPTKKADVHIGKNDDGLYELLITPREHGIHKLEVLYGNDHIQGSPFSLRVSAPPDASQVIARGPGLNHGIVTDYNGRFICETKGAGAGQLKVRVHGPKGAFKVQMTRSSRKDRTIDVRYNPTEIGEYNIQVKWSDQHVPGSPFIINIVENETELKMVKQKNPIDPRFTSVSHNSISDRTWSEDL